MSNSPRLMAVRRKAARLAPKRGARRAETRRPHQDRGRVRLCVYQPCWLSQLEGNDEIEWSTGESIQEGDVQVFCVSSSFARHRWPEEYLDYYDSIKEELQDDPRLGTVHSLWQVISPIKRSGVEDRWPIQAKFKLLVLLRHPIPKEDLRKANLLAKMGQWPQHFRGKLFHSEKEIVKLAEVLANRNPSQREEIWKALSVVVA